MIDFTRTQTIESLQYVPDGIGFIELVDWMGDDLTVANAARVSFGKRVSKLGSRDERLIEFLAESEPSHTSPFRHAQVQFHVKAPEFVARQWYKHIIGGEYTFKDTAWNEISGRYVDVNEFWSPGYFRKAPENKKQGSIDTVHEKSAHYIERYDRIVKVAHDLYEEMRSAGIAPEQARAILPLSFYTEWYWTCSMQAAFHFVRLRNHPDAQKEIREYAEIIDSMLRDLFPITYTHFKENA